jgi:hypothetical protein
LPVDTGVLMVPRTHRGGVVAAVWRDDRECPHQLRYSRYSRRPDKVVVAFRYNSAAKEAIMRQVAILMFVLTSTMLICAQGPCNEAVVKEGKLPIAEDAFSYMPPYGKPVSGKAAIEETAKKKFGSRTNVKRGWESDRRIAASSSGDMAYEHGTLDISYDEEGKTHSFKAVMLNVYKAKGNVCERVAGTMQPLESDEH